MAPAPHPRPTAGSGAPPRAPSGAASSRRPSDVPDGAAVPVAHALPDGAASSRPPADVPDSAAVPVAHALPDDPERDRPGTTSALRELSPGRRALLVALRKHGEASVDELAQRLDVTPGAVRQQLQALDASGLVGHRDERRGPGRPRRLYRLTSAADGLFPQAYGDLTTELLGYVDDEDPALVERIFARRRDARVERTRRRLGDREGVDRVDELARILDEDGYLAEAEPLPDGGWRIREHNCAILAVAGRHPHACTSEMSFLREVLPDADVRRVSHIASGDHACTYEVRPDRPAG